MSRLPYNGSGSFVFSVADYTVQPEKIRYQRIAGTPAVFFRRADGLTWVQLTVVETGEETEASVRAPVGLTYRVDLADALRFQGEIMLRIELSDGDGNCLSYTVPALTVDATGGRRRSVRR